jgi:hypothetical protein
MSGRAADQSWSIEAKDWDEAFHAVPKLLADFFERPDQFIYLDQERGKFAIGAGLWSRNGFYRLERAGAPPGTINEG